MAADPTNDAPSPPRPRRAPVLLRAERSLIEESNLFVAVLWLALPVLAEQLLAMAVGLSDQLITGHYFEQVHLAAINLMVYVLWLLNSLFVVVSIGATAMTARFVGAGDWLQARRVTNQAFVLGAALALLLTLSGLAWGRHLVGLMQLEGPSAELAVRYLSWLLPALPMIMCESVGIACLRGAGDMMSGLYIMVVVNLTNIAVSWSLALGLGPMPEMGWDGLALGTAVGHCLGGVLVVARLAAPRTQLRLSPRLLRPDIDLLGRLLRIGVPGGADVTSILVCQFWFVAIINRLGDLAAAAHGVAIRIESLSYSPGFAFQVAAATLAGQYLGARNYRRASRSVLLACLLGGGIMTAAAALFFFGADWLTGLMVSPQRHDVAQVAAPLLRIVAIGIPPFALTMILTGALRGAGDTRWPLVFTWIGYLGVRIPGAYLLAHVMGWGVAGAWYAMVADLMIRCVLVVYRFLHGGWMRVEV